MDAMVKRATRHLVGESAVEWYTPGWVLDAVRQTLRGSGRGDNAIDLDPASSERAQKRVKARYFYTSENDGLGLPWFGRVFCNPPYAMPEVSLFARKMADSWRDKCITAGIILTNNSTDTEWFHYMMREASALCLTRGRIAFHGEDGDAKAGTTHGQAFVYFGRNPKRFASHFSEFGVVCYGAFMQARRRIDNR